MWCAVVNRAIYASSEGKLNWTAEDLGLHTARSAVGESEKDQIKSRLDGWAQELLVSCRSVFSLMTTSV
jgi:tRNA A64-2'-O-ribosylphosphate transferase